MIRAAFPGERLPFLFEEDVVCARATPNEVGTVRRVGWMEPEGLEDDEDEVRHHL